MITTTTSLRRSSCHHQYCQCSHHHRHRHRDRDRDRRWVGRNRGACLSSACQLFNLNILGGILHSIVQNFRGSLPILAQEHDHSNFFFQPTLSGDPFPGWGERMTDLSQQLSLSHTSDDVVSKPHREHGCDRFAGSSKVWGLLADLL